MDSPPPLLKGRIISARKIFVAVGRFYFWRPTKNVIQQFPPSFYLFLDKIVFFFLKREATNQRFFCFVLFVLT